MIATLRRLRDIGNTVLVVEHDEDTIAAADHVVEMGPGAGVHGGEVVAQGTYAAIRADEASLTGSYLSGRQRIETPARRRRGDGRVLRIRGDLGPEGGHEGGELVVCGTPEEVAACPRSHTGRFLRRYLEAGEAPAGAVSPKRRRPRVAGA